MQCDEWKPEQKLQPVVVVPMLKCYAYIWAQRSCKHTGHKPRLQAGLPNINKHSLPSLELLCSAECGDKSLTAYLQQLNTTSAAHKTPVSRAWVSESDNASLTRDDTATHTSTWVNKLSSITKTALLQPSQEHASSRKWDLGGHLGLLSHRFAQSRKYTTRIHACGHGMLVKWRGNVNNE